MVVRLRDTVKFAWCLPLPHCDKESIRAGRRNSERWPLPAWPRPVRIGLIELDRAPMEIGTPVWGVDGVLGVVGSLGAHGSKTRSGVFTVRRRVGARLGGRSRVADGHGCTSSDTVTGRGECWRRADGDEVGSCGVGGPRRSGPASAVASRHALRSGAADRSRGRTHPQCA